MNATPSSKPPGDNLRQTALLCGALFCSVWLLSVGCATSHVPLPWVADPAAAQAQASQTTRPVLMLFTGSDWCPPCMALEKYVMGTTEFATYASNNVVLFKVDFPEHHKQSDAEKERNEKLRVQYNVEGYPTLVFLGPDGREVGRNSGTEFEKPADLIQRLEQIRKPK